MKATILIVQMANCHTTAASGYLLGGVISLLILGYLIFSLIKPEKF